LDGCLGVELIRVGIALAEGLCDLEGEGVAMLGSGGIYIGLEEG
jgi:hypothetical protein